MGTSSPAVAPPPETVAAQFTKVYYTVAARQPQRLAELYGSDSEVSHVSGVILAGLSHISSAALSLPLANQDVADVRTVDAMHTANGGYVVVVTGALNSAAFTQTFVLDSAGDGDSKEHFYCRNDIFRFVTSSVEKPTVTPADVLVPKRAQPVQVNAGAAPVTEVASAEDATTMPASGSAGTGKDPTSLVAKSREEDADEDDDEDADEDDVDDDDEDDDEDDEEDEVDDEDEVSEDEDKVESGNENLQAKPVAPVSSQVKTAVGNDVETKGHTDGPASTGGPSNAPVPVLPSSGTSKDVKQDVVDGKIAESKTGDAQASDTSCGVKPLSSKSEIPAKPSAPKSWASIVSSSSSSVSPQAPVASAASTAAAAPTISGPAVAAVASGDGPTKAPDASRPSTNAPIANKISGNNDSGGAAGGQASVGSQSYHQGTGTHTGSGYGHHYHHNQHHNGGSSHGNGPHHGHHHHSHHNASAGSGGGWSSVDSKRHGGHHNDGGFKTVSSNGHQGHHGYHSKHSAPRVYGPSAVVQLSSLPEDHSHDWRVLQQEFSVEFAGYGYEIRNVEVKMQRGLAFIEYDSSEGVRAAVNAWADGPRDSGPFKGIALAVSEKRQRPRHIPGSDHGRGGGRGSMRGGGRGGGRGRGRGMSMSGSGAPGTHPSTATPTAASS